MHLTPPYHRAFQIFPWTPAISSFILTRGIRSHSFPTKPPRNPRTRDCFISPANELASAGAPSFRWLAAQETEGFGAAAGRFFKRVPLLSELVGVWSSFSGTRRRQQAYNAVVCDLENKRTGVQTGPVRRSRCIAATSVGWCAIPPQPSLVSHVNTMDLVWPFAFSLPLFR